MQDLARHALSRTCCTFRVSGGLAGSGGERGVKTRVPCGPAGPDESRGSLPPGSGVVCPASLLLHKVSNFPLQPAGPSLAAAVI